MSSGKCRPFCLGLNVLMHCGPVVPNVVANIWLSLVEVLSCPLLWSQWLKQIDGELLLIEIIGINFGDIRNHWNKLQWHSNQHTFSISRKYIWRWCQEWESHCGSYDNLVSMILFRILVIWHLYIDIGFEAPINQELWVAFWVPQPNPHGQKTRTWSKCITVSWHSVAMDCIREASLALEDTITEM